MVPGHGLGEPSLFTNHRKAPQARLTRGAGGTIIPVLGKSLASVFQEISPVCRGRPKVRALSARFGGRSIFLGTTCQDTKHPHNQPLAR